jgi:hypothetical protein
MTTATSNQAPRQFTAFRCPQPILRDIKARAEEDGRSLSNFIVHILSREVSRTNRRRNG